MWPQVPGSTLDPVMACCLMSLSHYLYQCWLIFSNVFWHSLGSNFTGNAQDIHSSYEFENYSCIPQACELTHWGRVTHICVSKLTTIGSDNGLSPARRQAIIWTNAGILLIRPWGTNFSEILIVIHTFQFKKIRFNLSSVKWRPFCLGLNELN